MTEHGKMQRVVMRVLAVMLVASFLLAVVTFAVPGPVVRAGDSGGTQPQGICANPTTKEICSLSCCYICQAGGCCGGNYPCRPYRFGCIRRCDRWCPGWGCLSGWYCKSTLCSAGCCN